MAAESVLRAVDAGEAPRNGINARLDIARPA